MDIKLQPGRYIVAVSGGVDSVVLLHMLSQLPKENYQFTVAHFDHGIRKDSHKDRRYVHSLAKQYKIPFVYNEGNLGPGASEDEARKARYMFLHTVRKSTGAQALITGHHQDDLIETALLNMLRGTGRKGMSSLQSTDTVQRPLLHVPKTAIKNYAKSQALQWREDSTNADTRYKRNHVRHKLVPKLTIAQRRELLGYIADIRSLNARIDEQLAQQLQVQPSNSLGRRQFIQLPFGVAIELLAEWLRYNSVRNFDRKGLIRMYVQAKTLQHGQRIDVNTAYFIAVSKTSLVLTHRNSR